MALTAVFSFDTAWDGVLWMLDGHELHLIDDDTRRDPEALADYIDRERIDFLDLTRRSPGSWWRRACWPTAGTARRC
ncbi:hypothetical protein ACR6C2_37700 [Streptomyces sp. INA 01156]